MNDARWEAEVGHEEKGGEEDDRVHFQREISRLTVKLVESEHKISELQEKQASVGAVGASPGGKGQKEDTPGPGNSVVVGGGEGDGETDLGEEVVRMRVRAEEAERQVSRLEAKLGSLGCTEGSLKGDVRDVEMKGKVVGAVEDMFEELSSLGIEFEAQM